MFIVKFVNFWNKWENYANSRLILAKRFNAQKTISEFSIITQLIRYQCHKIKTKII